MRSWYGSTWDSSSPTSNLSASAPPFSVASPSAPIPDLGPNMDSGDPLIFPLNTSLNSRVSPNPTVSVPDWISSPVDPELDTVNYTGENPYSSSYSDFSGVSRSNVNEVRTYYPQYYFPELDSHKPLNFDNHPSCGGLSASRGGTERGSLYNDRTNGFFSLSSPLHVSDVCSEATNRGWHESTPFCSALNSGTDGSVHRSYKHQGTQSFDGFDASTEASNDVDVLNRGYQAVSTRSELVDMNLFPGNNIEVMNDSPPMADSTSVLSQEYFSAPPLDFCVEPRNYHMGYSNLVGNCSGEHFSGQGNGYSVIDNVLSSARPPIAAKISERNVLPDATQHRAGQGEKNIRIGRFRIGNGDYLKNEEVSGDTFDRLSTPVSRVEAPCMVVDGLNLAHESNHACSAFENVSESLNHYGHTVDSPCWKGVSIKRLGSSKACEIVAPNHVSEFKDLNSLNPHISQVSAENFVCELNIFTQKQSELTTQERNMISGKKSARPEEQPEVQHSSAPGVGFGDILEVCPCHLRPSYSCMSQGSEDVYAPWKRHASIDKLAGNVSGKISKVKRNSYVPDVTMKEKQPSLGDGSDLDRKIHDAIDMGLSDVSMRCVEHVLSSPPSTMKATAKHSNIHGEEFTPRTDVSLLIKTMLNLSELLLFHNFSGTSDLKEQDYEVLKMVSNNLEACYLKDVKLVSRSKESSIPVQDGSPFHRESLKHQKNEELKQPVGSSRGIDDQECPAAATNAAENMQSSLGGMLEKDGSNPYSKLSQMRIVEGTQLPNQKEQTDTSCDCEKHSVLLGLPEDDNPNNLTHHGLACFVKQDKITQDIKRILMENFHEEVGLEPQTHLLKNLWLEAEAALCSVNYMSRYNHMKFQMVKSKPVNEKDAYENAKPDLSIPGQRSMDAADDVMDKARERGIYSLNDVEVEHPSTEVADISVLPSSVPHPDHLECSSVLERSSILKQRLDYKNSTKSDDLSPRFMDIPSTPPSDILESSVMADFSILKHRDDVISSSVCNVAAVESLNLESAVKHDYFVEHHISQSQLNGSCLHPAAESPSPLRHISLEWEHVHREEINILR